MLAAGIALAALGGFAEANRAEELEHALSVLAPVLPGARVDPGALAGEANARRYARAAAALERAAGPSVSSPFSGLHPGRGPLRSLAHRAVTDAVVRPAEEALRARIAGDLRPGADPRAWLDRASAALARGAERGPFGPAAVLAAAYHSPEATWRRRLAGAARRVPAGASSPLSGEAKGSFVRTMETWGRARYANGSLVRQARHAAGATRWRERLAALRSVEAALAAGEGGWLSPGGSDPELEGILARARGVLDEETVETGRAAVRRVGEAVRAELASLRLGGELPLLDLEGREGPTLGPAVQRLLGAYAALARETLLATDGSGSRTAYPAGAGTTARGLVASLKRLERRFERGVAGAGVGPSDREWLRDEIEKAAFDEAADRIEAAAVGPLAAPERAAVREVERLARERGAIRAADRVGSVRARVEEAATRAALRAIEREDPLAVEFDADTDRRAVHERVVAGIERLDALHRQEPGPGGFRWKALGRALRGYRNADPSSVLARMAERAREYAERGTEGCATPDPEVRTGSAGGYPERALAAFERRLDALCREAGARTAAAGASGLRTFFREHLAWRWPYADDPGAPAAPRSTVAELLRRSKGRELEALPPDLRTIVEPWSRNRRGEPVLALGVEWRTAPERERFSEHLVSSRIDGLETLGNGRRGWRYGDRLVAHLRLAKDSPLRFPGGAVEASIPIDRGSWVRRLAAAGAAAATIVIDAPVAGGRGEEGTLRISATIRLLHVPRAIDVPARAGPSLATARPIRASRSPLSLLL